MKPAYHTPKSVPPAVEAAQLQKKAFKNAQRRATEAKGVNSSGKSHGPVPTIELYQKEGCPFSHLVRTQLTQMGLDYVSHNVPDDQPLKHEQLIQAGGKDQVPFLIDHSTGTKLYESMAILAYLDKTYGTPLKSNDWLGRIAKSLDIQIRAWAEPIAWRVSTPLIRAQKLQINARGAWQTLEGSWDFVRSKVKAAMDEAQSKASQSQSMSGEDDKAAGATPVEAEVASATEAA